ncbi:MAG: aspartate-semialdehyde dehydrogenase [Candidatus Excrementavichristensenella sp.]|jgi:aspartate-semialdehyde dehydrogenase
MKKYRVGVVGATGMVGQRFITLLDGHPWFDVQVLAASPRSAGKSYREAVEGKWSFACPIPAYAADMVVADASRVEEVSGQVDFILCAVDMKKEDIRALEERYARCETPVVSNNSAFRYTPDVPMMIPEINPEHMAIIPAQRKRLGTKSGFITCKPNCSIQSYVPALSPLRDYGIAKISVCTYQAISGAGKTFATWPEMVDNVIPFIGGEEYKSEVEPLKIWGSVVGDEIVPAQKPIISAQCYRVAATDGHVAAVSVSFDQKPPMDEILSRWAAYKGLPQKAGLPSAPAQFLTYFTEDNRPQTRLDRDIEKGMGISIGRLREDSIFDYKFVSLSHNTLRGAAGGAVETAEMLCHEGYIAHK